jgi:5-methylcytosine-specific restriction endonuclease McrA
MSACAEPGCPELTPTTYCPAHTEQPAQRKDRGLTGQRGSTRRWRKTRAKRIAIDSGRCTECGSTEFLHVHHVDGDPTDDRMSNLRTLCEDCHRAVERTDVGGAPRPAPADTAPTIARNLYES